MKYENGKITVDLYTLLGDISKEHRADLIDSLSCQQEVIDEVMNQVLDGFTTLGSHGPCGGGGNPDAVYGIEGARMRIAKAASDVAAKEIERLGAALKRAEAAQQQGWDAYHALMDQRRGSFA